MRSRLQTSNYTFEPRWIVAHSWSNFTGSELCDFNGSIAKLIQSFIQEDDYKFTTINNNSR